MDESMAEFLRWVMNIALHDHPANYAGQMPRKVLKAMMLRDSDLPPNMGLIGCVSDLLPARRRKLTRVLYYAYESMIRTDRYVVAKMGIN